MAILSRLSAFLERTMGTSRGQRMQESACQSASSAAAHVSLTDLALCFFAATAIIPDDVPNTHEALLRHRAIVRAAIGLVGT